MADHISDALRPTIEQCLESTLFLLADARVALDAAHVHEDLAIRQSVVTMYENRVAKLEELLR